MCRIFLYLSNNLVNIEYILHDSPHCIAKQSYENPYLPNLIINKDVLKVNPKLNLDGYGIVYKNDKTIKMFKSHEPIIGHQKTINQQLLTRIKNINSDFIMIFIRNNNHKNKTPNQTHNVQPFKFQGWYFMHNGGFTKYFDFMKNKMVQEINSLYLDYIGKNLDSKVLFCYLLTQISRYHELNQQNILEIVVKTINYIYQVKPTKFNVTLNFVLTNPSKQLYIITRYRTCKQEAAALYYKKNNREFMVSSEPIDYDDNWTLLKNQLLILYKNNFKIIELDQYVDPICST